MPKESIILQDVFNSLFGVIIVQRCQLTVSHYNLSPALWTAVFLMYVQIHCTKIFEIITISQLIQSR